VIQVSIEDETLCCRPEPGHGLHITLVVEVHSFSVFLSVVIVADTITSDKNAILIWIFNLVTVQLFELSPQYKSDYLP
jgi:hypothetical protein